MAVLLGVVFQLLVSHARIDQSIEKIQEQVLARQGLQVRLERMFMTAERFAVDGKSVEVLFDGGIDPDPVFSGKLMGVLDWEEKELCLKQRPLVGKEERKEVLWKGAQKLQWQFLNDQGEWVKVWPKNRGVPSVIRLKLDEIAFAFIRPGQKPMVVK